MAGFLLAAGQKNGRGQGRRQGMGHRSDAGPG